MNTKTLRNTVIALALLAVGACASNPRTMTPTPTTDGGGTNSTLGVFTSMVRCESMNNDKQTCKADARDRMVSLNQQLSNTSCIFNRSWGVSNDRGSIWVDHGCRAEFLIGGSAMSTAAFGRSVLCESQNNGKTNCPIDTSAGIQIARQISENGCVRGTDWGYDENGIWVDHGCRAEFVIGGDPRFAVRTSATPGRVLCESQNEATQRCEAETFYGVTLARQISNSTCVRGRTWGYDANGIWVSGGCRAEFVLGE